MTHFYKIVTFNFCHICLAFSFTVLFGFLCLFFVRFVLRVLFFLIFLLFLSGQFAALCPIFCPKPRENANIAQESEQNRKFGELMDFGVKT